METSLHEGISFKKLSAANKETKKTDLKNALFNKTKLKEADFTTASNYIIDPEINAIKKAKFSLSGVSGLLNKYDIKIE